MHRLEISRSADRRRRRSSSPPSGLVTAVADDGEQKNQGGDQMQHPDGGKEGRDIGENTEGHGSGPANVS